VSIDEFAELPDNRVMPSESQVGVDPIFERNEALFFQSVDVSLRKRLVREVCKRRSAPERKSAPQTLGRSVRVVPLEVLLSLARELLEAFGVELIAAELQHVSGRAGDEQFVVAASAPGLERLAQV
jgi:hypothetical protein